jgi:hypothetical protein
MNTTRQQAETAFRCEIPANDGSTRAITVHARDEAEARIRVSYYIAGLNAGVEEASERLQETFRTHLEQENKRLAERIDEAFRERLHAAKTAKAREVAAKLAMKLLSVP